MSEQNLSWKLNIYFALPLGKFCRSDTCRWSGRSWYTFPMTCSPKYIWTWRCIYSMYIYYTRLKMFLLPSVVFLMNESRPQPYFFDSPIKWSIMYLEFVTDIYDFSSSLYIPLVAWRKSLIHCGSPGYTPPFKWAYHIVQLRRFHDLDWLIVLHLYLCIDA